jgi:hypothetical protein
MRFEGREFPVKSADPLLAKKPDRMIAKIYLAGRVS